MVDTGRANDASETTFKSETTFENSSQQKEHRDRKKDGHVRQ
ncbi:hypothetical protein ABZ484_14340 [Streptomyces sp. NPDC006393]